MKSSTKVQTEIETMNVSLRVNEIREKEFSSPVIERLIEEVKNEEVLSINAYNRMHNRHNRSR